MKGDTLLWYFLFLGGIFGGMAVLLSAWGAHGLEELFIESPKDRFSFNYATNFQLFHTLLLGSIAFYMILSKTRPLLFLISSVLLILGIFLFSFPIYVRIIWGYSELSWLTPLGGICFFLAWSLISFHSISKILFYNLTR